MPIRIGALVVDNHGFERSSGDHQLLVQVVSRLRYPLSHQQFVPGTAQADQVDPVGAHCFCPGDHLWQDLGLLDRDELNRLMDPYWRKARKVSRSVGSEAQTAPPSPKAPRFLVG